MPIIDNGGDDLPKGGQPGNPPGGGPGIGPNGGPTAFGIGGIGGVNGSPSGYGFTPNVGWHRLGAAMRMKKGGAVRGPGSATSDSIPARLSAGEFVVNAHAAAAPGVKALLEHLNAHRDAHFAHANAHAERAHALAQTLVDHIGKVGTGEGASRKIHPAVQALVDHLCSGGPVHMALGGSVGSGWFQNPSLSDFARNHGGATPAPPAANPNAPTGGFNPADPWGANANDQRGDMNGDFNRIIGAAGKAGYFDPNGSPALMESLRQNAQGNADALTRQATLGADVAGMDPAQAAATRLQANLANQGNVAGILSQGRLGELQNQQQFAQGLFSGNAQSNAYAQLQQWLNNHQQQSNPMGQIVGGLAQGVGAGVGSGLGRLIHA